MYKIILNPCLPEILKYRGYVNETCASKSDINKVLANSVLSVLIIDKYFNDTDFADKDTIGPVWRKPTLYQFNFANDISVA